MHNEKPSLTGSAAAHPSAPAHAEGGDRHLASHCSRHRGKRDKLVQAKVSEGEKACIKQAAEAVGMTVTDYIVWSALYGDQCVYTVDPVELAALRTELARQGNNLNQIAHVANIIKLRRNKGQSVEDMLDDILGMLLRLNEEQHAAYKAVQSLQSSVYKSSLKRMLESDR